MRRTWTVCAIAGLAGPVHAQSVLYDNGMANGGAAPAGLATGTQTSGGVNAPSGYQWSELPAGNRALGFSADNSFSNRLADDFTVTSSSGWHITAIDTFGYITDTPLTGPSPFTFLSLQIWRGRPGDAGSYVVYGDTVSNRLAGSVQIMVLRGNAGGNSGGRIRTIWANTAAVNVTLGPGTYWLDIAQDGQLNGSQTGGFNPPVTIAGVRGPANADARQFLTDDNGPHWADMSDDGTLPAQVQELPFIVRGSVLTSTPCYANCDGSTIQPFLNVGDFLCFQSRYAAGDTYANCDGSTIPPVLNIGDFICFQTQFAAGCSSP